MRGAPPSDGEPRRSSTSSSHGVATGRGTRVPRRPADEDPLVATRRTVWVAKPLSLELMAEVAGQQMAIVPQASVPLHLVASRGRAQAQSPPAQSRTGVRRCCGWAPPGVPTSPAGTDALPTAVVSPAMQAAKTVRDAVTEASEGHHEAQVSMVCRKKFWLVLLCLSPVVGAVVAVAYFLGATLDNSAQVVLAGEHAVAATRSAIVLTTAR